MIDEKAILNAFSRCFEAAHEMVRHSIPVDNEVAIFMDKYHYFVEHAEGFLNEMYKVYELKLEKTGVINFYYHRWHTVLQNLLNSKPVTKTHSFPHITGETWTYAYTADITLFRQLIKLVREIAEDAERSNKVHLPYWQEG